MKILSSFLTRVDFQCLKEKIIFKLFKYLAPPSPSHPFPTHSFPTYPFPTFSLFSNTSSCTISFTTVSDPSMSTPHSMIKFMWWFHLFIWTSAYFQAMNGKQSQCCEHRTKYDSNSVNFYLSVSSNCDECFLKLFLGLADERNIKIDKTKLFSSFRWKRSGKGRLYRARDCYNVNFNCPTLGINCACLHKKHEPFETSEVPVMYSKDKNKSRAISLLGFPKYKGEGLTAYKKSIKRKQRVLRRIQERVDHFIYFFGKCTLCNVYFHRYKDMLQHHQSCESAIYQF